MRALILLAFILTAAAEHCEFPQGSNDGWASTDLTLADKVWTIDYDIKWGAAYLAIDWQAGGSVLAAPLGGALGARGRGSIKLHINGPITVRWMMVPESNMTPEHRVFGIVMVDWSMH